MPQVATLIADDGPATAPSGVDHVGLFAGPVWRYTLGDRPASLPLPQPTFTAEPGTELVLAIFPELDLPRYTATRVGIFASHAGQPRWLVDQHGHTLQPQGVSCLVADQWNLIACPLDEFVGQQVEQISLALPAGEGRGWLQVLGVQPTPLEPDDVVARALTSRGTHSSFAFSRGNTFPGACLPHGFVFTTPITNARADDWIYRWAQGSATPTLQALALAHQPSPWLRDRSACQLQPWFGSPIADAEARALAFDHRAEVARPDRYEVELSDPDEPANRVLAQCVPTEHGATMRFTFTDQAAARGVLLDQPGNPGARILHRLPDGRLRIDWWLPSPDSGQTGRPHPSPAAWVHLETLQPVTLFPRGKRLPARDQSRAGSFFARGNRLVGRLRERGETGPQDPAEPLALALTSGNVLEVRLAQSHISQAQARHNFELELATGSFDDIQATAHLVWADLLGRLEITGGNREQRTAAWSNLAQLHCWPNALHENAGSASTPEWVHVSPYHPRATPDTPEATGLQVLPGRLLVNNGYWDTYRTSWPAYHLLDPEHAGELLDGIIGAYRDSGWMSRWSAPGHADIMVGTSSDAICADAAAHGIAFEEESGYAAALRNALVPSSDPHTGRKGLARGRFVGYIDRATPEGFSWSIENANCDAALAAWAARRGDRATARYLANRALGWTLLYDPQTGFLRGREPDGSFASGFDPLAWGGDYTETNAWGMLFSPVWDGAGLARTLGGEQALAERLDQARATPETAAHRGSYRQVIHEMVEARALRLGQFAISNQPAHHMPWIYLHAGRPDRTQQLVREICDRLLVGSEIGQGYPGDEDNGEMSAWQLFALLGLYPLQLGSGEFVLHTPTFDDVSWRRRNGTTLRISAEGGGDYIESVRLNGIEWSRVAIPVQVLHGDCHLQVTRSTTPTDWGRDSRPSSMHDRWRPDRAADASLQPNWPDLTDDRGARSRTLAAGERLEMVWPQAFQPWCAALTFAALPTGRWQLAVRTARGWRDAGPVQQPRWPEQTTAQWLGDEPIDALAIIADSPLELWQVEVY